MSATLSVVSIGELADRNRVPLKVIEAIADRLKLRPPLLLNGVAYFNAADVAKVERLIVRRGFEHLIDERVAER